MTMNHSTLVGRGTLHLCGLHIRNIDYSIEVHMDDAPPVPGIESPTSMEGAVEPSNGSYRGQNAVLELETGRTMDIVFEDDHRFYVT